MAKAILVAHPTGCKANFEFQLDPSRLAEIKPFIIFHALLLSASPEYTDLIGKPVKIALNGERITFMPEEGNKIVLRQTAIFFPKNSSP